MYYTYTLYHSTQIDYIFYPKSFSSAVSNVKVVPNEECVKPHHMVVCDFIAHTPRVKKWEFLPRICTWKLWDPVNASQFQWAFKLKLMTASTSAANNAGVAADTANLTETVWSKLKDPLLDAATEVYGNSKNHQWRPETWWWNDAIPEKHARFKAYKALKKGGTVSTVSCIPSKSWITPCHSCNDWIGSKTIWLALTCDHDQTSISLFSRLRPWSHGRYRDPPHHSTFKRIMKLIWPHIWRRCFSNASLPFDETHGKLKRLYLCWRI